MKAYKNTSGNSDVKAYQIYKDAIKVQFNDGSIYLYSYEKNGEPTVEIMKALATSQQGLGTYISLKAKKETAEKLDGNGTRN
ncbi:MAG TPA: hypothetical protein VK528_13940 [Flavobacterium sp.]|nr:hypothetical protein [Flavobacterium sp.]